MNALVPGWGEMLLMMAATLGVLTILGLPLARRFAPTTMPAGALAPTLGLCLHLPLAALVLPHAGFSRFSIIGVLLASMAIAAACAAAAPRVTLPRWVLPVSFAAGAACAAAIMPHGSFRLSPPIFDHIKIALVDAIAREGLPAPNPFIGGSAPVPLGYYFWWHMAAAELARITHTGGWAADAALTGATASASLLLAAGVGQMVAGSAGGVVAPLLLLPGSLRWLIHPFEVEGWIAPGSGLEGWLNQAAWAPQHLASACCLVACVLLACRLRTTSSVAGWCLLGAAAAASFGCSVWVGGVAACACLPAAALVLLARGPHRDRFCAGLALASLIAMLLVASLVLAERHGASARGVGTPIIPGFFSGLGPVLPSWLAPLGFPLLWCIEFPALLVAVAGAVRVVRAGDVDHAALLAAAAACCAVSWFLRSTIANNDLGWRAMLPVLLIASGFAVPGWQCGWGARLVGTAGLLGLPGTALLLQSYLSPPASTADAALRASLPAWQALRGATPVHASVLTNPAFAAAATLWPANAGWALLANRRSCYAGWAAAEAFAPLSAASVYAIDQRVARVFAGTPGPKDLDYLAQALGCTRVLLLQSDPAFLHDPFPAAGWVQAAHGRGYRIYRAPPSTLAPP